MEENKNLNPEFEAETAEAEDFDIAEAVKGEKKSKKAKKDKKPKNEKAKKIIAHFNNNRQKYKFNLIGLACVSINKKIKRKNRFYCAEFVKHILKSSGVSEVKVLPEIIKPEDFKQINGLRLEYEGLLRKYKKKKYLKLEEVHQFVKGKKISYV